ncbi:MAG: efflux RND transporter periplasmic adaptor subunit [Prevotella sp.]|jgi:membrane fusion protein (multidrug efflux system)|nr:efflux RND transporter periplasmic adaptor subunit [Prevotella sp.]
MKIKSFMFVALATAALTACKGGGGMPNFGDNEYPVRTVSAQGAAMQTTYPATIKGIQDVEIHPKVSGFITKVCVKEGQSVAAGQLLFTIDAETYQAAVRQSQAAVNTARAQAQTAKMTYQNSQKLYKNNVIGQYELQSSQNTYASAQAQVSQAQAALTSAKEMLSFCFVKSPAAGVVGSLPFKVGALVSAASTLTTVSNISTMEVFFSMTEKDMLDMTKTTGSASAALASIPPVKLQLADGTIYDHPGKVVKMSGVIDAATGSVSMIAHFSNPEKLLKSGGSGSIVVPHDNSNAIVIPQECTLEVQNKIFVYILGKDNKVKYTEIKVDPQNDGKNYVVTDGLHVGDRYVTNGLAKLTDGLQIKPITPEEYQKKIADNEKLGAQQGSASGVIKSLSGK